MNSAGSCSSLNRPSSMLLARTFCRTLLRSSFACTRISTRFVGAKSSVATDILRLQQGATVLWRYADAHRGNQSLGRAVSRLTSSHPGDVLSQILRSGPNHQSGLERFVASRAIFPEVRVCLRRAERRTLLCFEPSFINFPSSARNQIIINLTEFLAGLLLKRGAWLESCGSETAVSVLFRHAPMGSPGDYDDAFHCSVHFRSPYNAIAFDEETLQSASRFSRPQVANAALETEPFGGDTVRATQGVLVLSAPFGDCNVESVARTLGLSRRTLQRRLATEGTTFSRLVDDMRCRLTLEWLQCSQWSISEIARAIGFSENGAFYRAFRRWTGGDVPQAYRHLARL